MLVCVPPLFFLHGWHACQCSLSQHARSRSRCVRVSCCVSPSNSSKFPCVEIDTSTYAIPQQDAVKQWIACVPPGFKFHIKAFGIFTAPDKKTPVQSMPGAVTRTLPPSLQSKSSLSLADLPQDAVEALWERFTAVLRILEDAGKLGMVRAACSCVLLQ